MMTSGWIGVDLDGTLAHYESWDGGSIGKPVPAMVTRVQNWLRQGKRVKVFTARVAQDADGSQCRAIQAWCRIHIGQALEVTCSKDFAMTELWDDRCVQVRPNTGEPVGYVEYDAVPVTEPNSDGKVLTAEQYNAMVPHANEIIESIPAMPKPSFLR